MIRALRDAEDRARKLFDACIERCLIAAGKSEGQLSNEISEVASEMFGVHRFWHKRIVRAGRNTLLPYAENPPDLVIQADDILFLDFGPVFEEWEADLGRTFVLGNDPRKRKLAADVEWAWDRGAEYYRANEHVTGAQLYGYVSDLAKGLGWQFGQIHCGHLIGRFPHLRLEGDRGYLRADNPEPMRRLGADGERLRWILEVHFVDRASGFGGFQEALLLEVEERERSR